MKFTWLHYLAVGLLAVIVCLLLFWPKKQDSTIIIQARDSIEVITERNQILAMTAKTLEVQLTEVRVKSSSDSMAFRMRISKLERSLVKKRVKIDTLILENPDLADFVATADTVIFTMRQRIDSLEAQAVFKEGLYSQMIYIKDKQLSNLEMVVTQKDIVIKDLEKQARKKRRGTKVLKVLAVTGAVGGILLGSSL